MTRKPRQQSWRGKTLGERVKLLETETNALNKAVLDLRARVDQLESSDLRARVEQLENHPAGCSCTRCTG